MPQVPSSAGSSEPLPKHAAGFESDKSIETLSGEESADEDLTAARHLSAFRSNLSSFCYIPGSLMELSRVGHTGHLLLFSNFYLLCYFQIAVCMR